MKDFIIVIFANTVHSDSKISVNKTVISYVSTQSS